MDYARHRRNVSTPNDWCFLFSIPRSPMSERSGVSSLIVRTAQSIVSGFISPIFFSLSSFSFLNVTTARASFPRAILPDTIVSNSPWPYLVLFKEPLGASLNETRPGIISLLLLPECVFLSYLLYTSIYNISVPVNSKARHIWHFCLQRRVVCLSAFFLISHPGIVSLLTSRLCIFSIEDLSLSSYLGT